MHGLIFIDYGWQGAPQFGLGSVHEGVFAENECGGSGICSTHHEERSLLNFRQPLNIRCMDMTVPTSHIDTS